MLASIASLSYSFASGFWAYLVYQHFPQIPKVRRGMWYTLRQVHSGERWQDKQTNTCTAPQYLEMLSEEIIKPGDSCVKTWRENIPDVGSLEQNPRGSSSLHVHYGERLARDMADCELGISDSPHLVFPTILCSWYSYHPYSMDRKWNKIADTWLQNFAIKTEARIKLKHHDVTCWSAHTITYTQRSTNQGGWWTPVKQDTASLKGRQHYEFILSHWRLRSGHHRSDHILTCSPSLRKPKHGEWSLGVLCWSHRNGEVSVLGLHSKKLEKQAEALVGREVVTQTQRAACW